MTIKVKPLRRRLFMVGALAMIIGAFAATTASASTNMPVWSSSGSQLPFGTETPFSGESEGVQLRLRWSSGGVEFEVDCYHLSAGGTVENYASGKPGTIAFTPGAAKFKGCFLAKPMNSCHVPSEIPVNLGTPQLTNTPYENGGLKLSNLSMTIQTEGCPGGTFALPWKVSASPTGKQTVTEGGSEISFPWTTATVSNGTAGKIEFGLKPQATSAPFAPFEITEEEITPPSTPGHHYWYTGGGMRKGEGPQTLVPAGTPLSLTKGSANITLEATLTGVPVKISCTGTGGVAGSVENPSGGGDGIANASFGFEGCSVVKPEKKSCTVQTGSIGTVSMPGSVYGALEWPYFRFLPASGPISTFNLSGCTIAELNGEYKLTGSLFTQPHINSGSKPGSWSIPAEQNNGKTTGLLKLRNTSAQAYGEVTAENTAGEIVALG